jgi:putative transposase
MRTHSYPSDVTDKQWARVEPLLPVYPGGRPRTTDLRDVLDAIFYLLRTGCQWRYLPKDFPPKSTVWRYFDEWRHNGTLEKIHDALRDEVRRREKPGRPRRTASIDSQSVDTSSGGEARGRDNAKNADGRKRHLVVDSLGLLLAAAVTAASADDAAAAPEALRQLHGRPVGKVRRVYADSKYHNRALYGWVEENGAYELDIVRRPRGAKGWVRLPIRWTVERTFAWLGKCRRLSVDREKTTRSAEAMIRLAMIHLMLNRLDPKGVDAEFHYRKAS